MAFPPWTEEHEAFRDMVRRFAREEIRPNAEQWQEEAYFPDELFRKAGELGLQVVSMRFGVVLSGRGGALGRMLPPFKLGLGGSLGSRESWFPWIHEDDAVGLLLFALHSAFPDLAELAHAGMRGDPLSGPVNAVAPEAVRMGEFAATLGRVLRRPARLGVPAWALRLALGELADGLVPGQKVVPEKALAAGYRFRHPRLEGALRACLGRE